MGQHKKGRPEDSGPPVDFVSCRVCGRDNIAWKTSEGMQFPLCLECLENARVLRECRQIAVQVKARAVWGFSLHAPIPELSGRKLVVPARCRRG
jgi:hypothetical protein